MAKTIKVAVTAIIELPDSADVIRFTDEEGNERDCIKFAGMIMKPELAWMQYMSSAMSLEKYKSPAFDGIGWEDIPEEIYNQYFAHFPEEHYLEEIP
jgi:hypothetical protein